MNDTWIGRQTKKNTELLYFTAKYMRTVRYNSEAEYVYSTKMTNGLVPDFFKNRPNYDPTVCYLWIKVHASKVHLFSYESKTRITVSTKWTLKCHDAQNFGA